MLKSDLSVEKDTFNNPKLGEIHFKNGYIKLNTLTFHKRKRRDYMTYCIMREYKNPEISKKKKDIKYN